MNNMQVFFAAILQQNNINHVLQNETYWNETFRLYILPVKKGSKLIYILYIPKLTLTVLKNLGHRRKVSSVKRPFGLSTVHPTLKASPVSRLL